MQEKKDGIEVEFSRLNHLLATYAMNMTLSQEYLKQIHQRLKLLRAKKDHALLIKELELIITDIESQRRNQSIWERFEDNFSTIHIDFLKKIRTEFPELTTQDQKLCTYLRMNLNTNEIAKLMNITVRGVEVARYRLRKRLNLTTKQK